ncbi:MAG: YtxH domain-containing protein [Gemmatimonadota bacterium]
MSENQQQPYVIVERHGSGLIAFVMGAMVGAVTALLLAPKSGEETQRGLRDGARRVREDAGTRIGELRGSVEEGYEKARSEIGDRVESARDTVRDRRHRAEEALKAGKDAASQARTDLEQRVAESKAAYRAALDGATDVEPDDGEEAAVEAGGPDEDSEAS